MADIPECEPVSGLLEKRGGELISIDSEPLAEQLQKYFNPAISWEDYKRHANMLTANYHRFKPEAAWLLLRGTEFRADALIRYIFKPLDHRWAFYSEKRPLWNDPRPQLAQHAQPGNHFLVTRRIAQVEEEGAPFYFTRHLGDNDALRGHANFIPVWLHDEQGRRLAPNLSLKLRGYLRHLDIRPDLEWSEDDCARLVWWHVLAVGFAPVYLNTYGRVLRENWPHVPFPGMEDRCRLRDGGRDTGDDSFAVFQARDLFFNSARLGRRVAALLDIEAKPGDYPAECDPANLEKELAIISPITTKDGRAPDATDSFDVSAGWGKRIQRKRIHEQSVVLPKAGRMLRRPYTNEERRALERQGLERGLHAGAVYDALGPDTCDIFLNDRLHWRNIPARVWGFAIGGYPILRKWLSYRERDILGRGLHRQEVDGFSEISRRLAALRLLEPALDHSFSRLRDATSGTDPVMAAPATGHRRKGKG